MTVARRSIGRLFTRLTVVLGPGLHVADWRKHGGLRSAAGWHLAEEPDLIADEPTAAYRVLRVKAPFRPARGGFAEHGGRRGD